MKKPLHVTDHAVLRYLQRAKGFDIDAVRQHISQICMLGHAAGASSVKAEGVRFILHSACVITTEPLGNGQTAPSRTAVRRLMGSV